MTHPPAVPAASGGSSGSRGASAYGGGRRDGGPTRGPRVRLVRGARPPLPAPALDPDQQAAVDHRGGPLRLLGAPGTGVTTTLVEAVVDRVQRDGLTPDQVLVLAPTRRAAAALRERVTGRLARTVREPIARTPASLAFDILRRASVAEGGPPPGLLSGPEQDAMLRDLLAGHAAGAGRAPDWPDNVRAALTTRGLRTELRDLMMRAVERGLGPDDLARLGAEHDRPEWVAAAQVLEEYEQVTALATPGAFDPALILSSAEAALADADLLAQVRRSARFVAVDDAQELTPAAYHLLLAVAGAGGSVLLAGDPDAATLGFRGADPAILAGRADELAAPGQSTETIVLGTCWRHGPELRSAARRVVDRVGATARADVRRARPAAGRPDGVVETHLLRSPVQEAAYVAGRLRRAHLQDGVPWGQMAVIVRGTGRAATLRRVLAAERVPVTVPPTEVPVRAESAVGPLLLAYEAALALAAGADAAAEVLDIDTTLALLGSPLGGADAVALRRLRRALRLEERAGGGRRGSNELLVEAIAAPGRVATLDPNTAAPARRVADVLEAGRRAATGEVGRAVEGVASRVATAETVLWAIWDASGLAEPWRRAALGGGPGGPRADRDLDAVVGLFDAAARFVDRRPLAGPAEFLQQIRDQDVPGDTLVERAPDVDAVALVTPQGAAGNEWRLVVVAGVQTGVWPDTRLRGSLLGAQALVDVLAGRGEGSAEALRSAQAAVRQEELRLFHVAVSRATEHLLVTAVSGEDEQPSGLVDLVAADGGVTSDPSLEDDERPVTTLPRAMSLPALVARLRQLAGGAGDAVGSGGGVRAGTPAAADAARALARLAAAGVPGAHPDEWHGLAPVSDPGPVVPADRTVPVSPSKVEGFEQCGLRWVLESSGGRVTTQLAQSIGNLIHQIARDLPAADEPVLRAALAERWDTLGLPPGWVTDVQRERAEVMVAKLAAYYQRSAAEGREVLAVEERVRVQIGRAVVAGQVDRLERTADGELYIVDLKTGRTQVPDADVVEHRQLGIYQLAVQAGGFDADTTASAGGELVLLGVPVKTLPTKVQPPLPPAGAEVGASWARQVLDEAAEGMGAATFVAQQGSHCRNCPVRTSCPTQPEGRGVTA